MASGYQPNISDIGNIDADMADLPEEIADLGAEKYSFMPMPNQEDNAAASGMLADLPEEIADLGAEKYSFMPMPIQEDNAAASGMLDDLPEEIADLGAEKYSFMPMPNQEDNAAASGMLADLPIKEGNALSLKQVEALRSLGLPEDIRKAMTLDPKKKGYGRYPSKKPPIVKERLKHDSSLIRKPGDDAKWEEQYKRLVEYYQIHGNCNVPRSHTKLGNWVTTQRSSMSNKKRGLNTPMTTYREEKLNNIGFRWDRYQDVMTKEGDMADQLDGAAGSATHHLASMPPAWQMNMADQLDGAAGSATHHLASMPDMEMSEIEKVTLPVASESESESESESVMEMSMDDIATLPIPEGNTAAVRKAAADRKARYRKQRTPEQIEKENKANQLRMEQSRKSREGDRGKKRRIRITRKRKYKRKSKKKSKRKSKKKSKRKSKKKSKRKK